MEFKDCIQFVKRDETDFSVAPARFIKDGQPAYRLTNLFYVYVWDGENPVPIHYMWAFYGNQPSPVHGLCRLGKDSYTQQALLPEAAKLVPWAEIQDVTLDKDPEGLSEGKAYQVVHPDPGFYHVTSTDHLHVKENNVVDLWWHFFPESIVMNDEVAYGLPYLTNFADVEGLIGDKHVKGFGVKESVYFYGQYQDHSANDSTLIFYGCGRRKDGKYQYAVVGRYGNGNTWASYKMEGEDPVVAEHVEIHADMENIPYFNDKSMQPVNAELRFGEMVIHFQPKWAMRGSTDGTTEAEGMTHATGTWYTNDNVDEMDMCFAYTECSHVTTETPFKNDF